MADSELKDKVQLLSVRDAQREIEKGVDTYDDQSIYEKFLSENDHPNSTGAAFFENCRRIVTHRTCR